MDVMKQLSLIGIVPVIAINDAADAVPLAKALIEGGLPCAEVTFRTSATEEIIREAAKEFPELYLGAGTILNSVDLHRAFDAGAKFAVAPGFNKSVVNEAVKNDFAFAPGVCTPSEVEQAVELGCKFLKFFPAEAAGGVKMLKSIIAPYRHLGIRFMPTGGVTSANAADYLAIKEVAAIGGTWLGKAEDIKAENWDAVAKTVKAAVELKNHFA